jgi:hypothetical protein
MMTTTSSVRERDRDWERSSAITWDTRCAKEAEIR